MAQTLVAETVEFAPGEQGEMPFNQDGSNSYLYPLVQTVPGELGGVSVYSLVCAASDNAAVIKSSAGQLYGFHCTHIDATPVFIKFYNTTSTPVLGTTSIFARFGAAAETTSTAGKSTDVFLPWGIPFSTGIAITVSTALPDATASGSLTASEVVLTVYYK